MHRLLLVTTEADNSAHFFSGVKGWHTETLLYGKTLPADIQADIVYFRDPFNASRFDMRSIEQTVLSVRANAPNAYYVDATAQLDDLLFEDKWRQYTLMPELFPHTELLGNPSDVRLGKLAKKRVSCRSRDIAFTAAEVTGPVGEYILQERMAINQELRVYVLGGKVLSNGTIKRSKTEHDKAKVQSYCELPTDVMAFAEKVHTQVPWLDLYGLDVASTDKGPRLIEINRSPQFSKYNELAQVNLAEMLLIWLETDKINKNP